MRNIDDIFANLKTLHLECHDMGIKTVALSIPKTGNRDKEYNDARK